MIRIFYIDRDPDFYTGLLCWLPEYCTLHKIKLSEIESALPSLKWETDIILINPDYTGNSDEFLSELIETLIPVPVIFLSESLDLPFLVSLIKLGAHSCLSKNRDKSILIETIKNLLYILPEQRDFVENGLIPEIVGSSLQMQKLKKEIMNLSTTSMHVHISGETGTGKEIAARAIHKYRSGKGKQLLALNCSSIAETLVETELFGTKKGAFTDAVERAGIFESADGSTLLLDEVSELPINVQAKLLRVLEYGTFNRVGGVQELKSNFQLITATNRILKEEVRKGTFREDLFYRITTLVLQIPPLRERKEDINELSRHFLKLNGSSKHLTAGALKKLNDHQWPGNVRELKQVIERAEHFSGKKQVVTHKDIVFY
ncbi:MAG: sigma-54-dependent Fis family transcriptional regulator [Spirochaetales bacterium]|nr:sigma-54-dependent Fis family transcriptional regulator [Spirochaetales bacterium]